MVDLRTTWLGLELTSPVVMGAGPLSTDADAVARAVDAGAGAIVMPSLFEVPSSSAPRHAHDDVDPIDAPSAEFRDQTAPYLRQLERFRKRFSVPIVASLSASSPETWAAMAALLARAGASAIELNLYEVASSAERTATIVEDGQLEAARAVVDAVSVPVSAKLGMFYTSVPAFAAALQQVGVVGVTVFSRFYQPDINLQTLNVDRSLRLSTSAELPPRLHALATLVTPPSSSAPLWLSCTGGVHTGDDVCKAILSGAHAVQTVSAVLQKGPERIRGILDELSDVMARCALTSVAEARGRLSLARVRDPDVWTRLNYVRQLAGWEAPPST
jgi:dihydroorotate dehydrogenase (fumarate)